MRVRLLHANDDRVLGARAEPSTHQRDLVADLGLDLLVDAMAGGDDHVHRVCDAVLLDACTEVEEVVRRQEVVADALAHPEAVAAMHAAIGAGLQTARRSAAGLYRESPEPVVRRAVERLRVHLDVLRRLGGQARRMRDNVRSAAWQELLAELSTVTDGDTATEVEALLEELTFPRGMLFSARIGRGATGVDHVLRRPRAQGWLARSVDRSGDSFELPERDDEALTSLGAWRERALAPVATELSAAADDVEVFLRRLRDELAFLLGAIHLHDRLAGAGLDTCFPEVVASGTSAPRWHADGLYDPALALRIGAEVVSGDLAADGAALIVVTGANQGGKSTLLRAVGAAQVLAQAGLFVPATAARLELRPRIFVHFGREEDRGLRRGRLEQELERMRRIVEVIEPGDLLLANESFASTNEAEGSAVAYGIFAALADAGVRVVAVTHLYELARGLAAQERADTIFLRARRDADGTRPFRVEPGAPQPTSYGRDLYLDIFGDADGQ